MNEFEIKAENILQPALDCFTGMDGGISFVKFKQMISALCKKANDGDLSAIKILDIVHQYNKLIELSIKKII